jgi:LmbE family N-acetylglucosaminyl deacetylase
MLPYLYYADPIEGVDVYGERIAPSTYVSIGETMATKTRALKAHASQRQWLMKHHGMDQYVQSMKDWGALRGKEVGVKYAEGFRQHKGHPYPHDCILKRELGELVQTV